MRFRDQVVWITGASSGIGEAAARAFAREGARLILSSRRREELERVRLACERPDKHTIVPLDLAQPESFAAVVTEVITHCGAIDVLVNNGGVGQRALAADASLDVERRIMEVNYFGPVALTKAVLPSMRSRRAGHIVVVSSVMGYVGIPGRSTYAASKHALQGYFNTLRAEVWADNIKVTLVCPGYVKTAISDHALGPGGEKPGRADGTPERGIAPEECAAAILNGVARRKNEVYVGGPEVAGIYVQRFMPSLFAWIARRIKFPTEK